MSHFVIKSDTLNTASTPEKLFDFMGDFNQFKHLLPQDKIEDFACTAEQCSFNIRGISSMTIRIKEKVPVSRITYETSGLAKFVFTLHILLDKDPNTCRVELEGDMNPFIKAMANKPLTELVDTMASKLSKIELQ